jgi:hypothetical protein
MTVWKRRRKKALNKKFTIEFSDHKAIKRRLAAFADKHTSEEAKNWSGRFCALSR